MITYLCRNEKLKSIIGEDDDPHAKQPNTFTSSHHLDDLNKVDFKEIQERIERSLRESEE